MIDIQGKAELLLRKGIEESLARRYDSAIKNIDEAQKLYLELNSLSQIATCLAELALIHYRNNKDRIIRSLTLLNDAKALINDHPGNAAIKAKIQQYYGIIYYSEKRFSEALKYFKRALELVSPNCIEYAKILDNMAIFYLRTNNYQIASKYICESLKIKQESGDKYELAMTRLLLGRYLINTEDYEEAILQLSQALEGIEAKRDILTISRTQDELAKIYIAQKNYKAAESLCLKSIELAKDGNAPLTSAFSYCTLASLMVETGSPEEALEILEKEVDPVFYNYITIRGTAISKKIKAKAYHKLQKREKAIENLQESIELFSQAQLYMEVAKSYHELSIVYKDIDNPEMALSYDLEALKIARENNLPLLTQKIEDFIFEIDKVEWSNIINRNSNKKELNEAGQDDSHEKPENTKIQRVSKDPLLALLRIARSIAAETDIDKLLEIIADETRMALKADRCTVFLLDRETNELWSKFAQGLGRQEIRFPINVGLAGHVASTGETINIKDAYNDERFNKEIDKRTGYKTKTILCMPMKNLKQEVIGVFQVLNKIGDKETFFNASDEDLLVAIGSNAGIALENASLLKKQQIMYEEQKRSLNSFINTLAASIDARDKITSGHSTRVTGYAIVIAKQLGLGKDKIDVLEYAALLHDFGKIAIKDSVLCKEGKLTDEEYKHIQEHAYITYEILKNMYFTEKFKDVPEIASSHHEKYNGTGYFRKAKGEEIPLGGRILAVADVFDAITSKRHYRDRMPFAQVLNILRKDSGSHFDGNIVNEFFNVTLEKILKVMLSKYDTPLNPSEILLFSNYNMNDIHGMILKGEYERNDEENELVNIFEKHYNPPQEKE